MGVRLTEDEAWAELAAAHTGILTTLRRDGRPVSLPVWFVALDRHVYVRTPARTHKVGHVEHDPRATFLVERGERWAELCAVMLHADVDPARRRRRARHRRVHAHREVRRLPHRERAAPRRDARALRGGVGGVEADARRAVGDLGQQQAAPEVDDRQTSAAAVSFCDGRTLVPFHSGMSSPTLAAGHLVVVD